MDKNKLIIYQINPRMFTPQGTLRAAQELLPHLASVGVNVVYLFSICKEDDSEDRTYWSRRQKASGLDNPKNPYRISDYYAIDEEYGGEEQFREFVEAAHGLGMAVMMDIVYFHCSPNARIITDVPEGIVRNERGEIELGEWNFPRLNFESRALRDYLIDNMCYWVREYGVDGFRCDVGDGIPLDFWKEAAEAARRLMPDLIMLNEGGKEEYVASGVFDMNYNGMGVVHSSVDHCETIRCHGIPAYNGIWFVENHDTVTDSGRIENCHASEVCDCFYVYLFTTRGTPLLYSGEEIGDRNPHNMFANKDHNRGYGVDWSNALLPHGKRRTALITELAKLRKTEDALAYGNMAWLDTEDGVLGYTRRYDGDVISVFINFGSESRAVDARGDILLARDYEDGRLRAYGMLICKATL